MARIEENPIISVVKAISQRSDLQNFFIKEDELVVNNFFIWNQDLISGNNISLPKSESGLAFASNQFRGIGDVIALYLLFHDQETHQKFSRKLSNLKLFDDFEKVRLILNIPDFYQGIKGNILNQINQDIIDIDNFNDLLPIFLLKNLFEQQKQGVTMEKINNLSKEISKELLGKVEVLIESFVDQEAFAKLAIEIIQLLENEEDLQKKESIFDGKNIEFSKENKGENDASSEEQNVELKATSFEEKKSAAVILKKIVSKGSGSLQTKAESKEDKIIFTEAYKVFSSKFDEITTAQKLVNKDELSSLRVRLEAKFGEQKPISKKIINKLKKKLLAKKLTLIEEHKNIGILNRRKLTKIILNPLEEEIFVDLKEYEYQDLIVAILLDNSGSMRGKPITTSALACENIVKVLQEFNVKTEILGFTTVDWRGGRVKKMWELEGKPRNAGRLNDLRHIVYKAANQNFKKSKVNLGLMIKEGMLKENIDGEALLWAKSRLMQNPCRRKILMVISDGAPIDDSTNANNDESILVNHLHFVISKIEKQSNIELVGIGIGHDVGQFYKNSIVIKEVDELGDVMIGKLIDLFN